MLPVLSVICYIDGIRKKADMKLLVEAQMMLHHFYIMHNEKTKIYTDGPCTHEASACAVSIVKIQEKRIQITAQVFTNDSKASGYFRENSGTRKWVI